jgi:hypothetical protein
LDLGLASTILQYRCINNNVLLLSGIPIEISMAERMSGTNATPSQA